MQRLTLLLVAVLACSTHANILNTKVLAHARNGVNRFQAILRGSARAMRAQDIETDDSPCGLYISSLVEQCTAWHDQLDSSNVDFETFCADPCWVSASLPNNTACLLQNKEISEDIQLLKVACSRKGPNNTYCGSVIMKLKDTDVCSQFNEDNCANSEREVQCEWDGNRCDVAVAKPYLDQICSPCIADLTRGIVNLVNASEGDQNGGQNQNSGLNLDVQVLNRFQQLLCVQVNDQFCAITVKSLIRNITEGNDVSSAQLNTMCADNTQPTCLRKMLPAIAGLYKAEAISNVMQCVSQYTYLSGNNFKNAVELNCLGCYRDRVIDIRRTLGYADNLCTKSDSGTYCLSLLNFHPSDALETCYINTVSSGACTSNCNSVFSAFFDTYGCCFGLFSQYLNKTSLVQPSDLTEFWGAAQVVKAQSTPVQGNDGSMAPMGSGGQCNSEDDSPNLSALGVCASLSDIRERLTTFCAYSRAPQKIARALHLKLNCSAVLENEDIKNSIVLSIVRDIAQNLGLPVDAITGVLFICPTEAPAAHHFAMLAAAPATLQFVIQSENAAATDAAAAQLDAAVSEGTLSFPALTATVSSVCTTCATESDLVSLASSADVVPTPAPPPPTTTTSAASSFQLLAALIVMLIAVVIPI